jgi:hypothetical protein
MEPELMLLGFHRAVGRFLDFEPADLPRAIRTATSNRHHPDLPAVLRKELQDEGAGDPDLDREIATPERYFALFEALNWGVSLDDRLTRDWPFEEIVFGEYWCDEFAGGGLIRGFRFARNAVHHDWSPALDPDVSELLLQPWVDLLSLCWVADIGPERADSAGKSAYREYLGGRVVGDTLIEIGQILEAGTRLTRGLTPIDGDGPARVKLRADDRYLPPEDGE